MGDQAEYIHKNLFPAQYISTAMNFSPAAKCEQVDIVHIPNCERATVPMREGFTALLNSLSC